MLRWWQPFLRIFFFNITHLTPCSIEYSNVVETSCRDTYIHVCYIHPSIWGTPACYAISYNTTHREAFILIWTNAHTVHLCRRSFLSVFWPAQFLLENFMATFGEDINIASKDKFRSRDQVARDQIAKINICCLWDFRLLGYRGQLRPPLCPLNPSAW